MRFPLLHKDGKFVCYAPALLESGMEHIIYDIMRGIDAEAFVTAFGEVFERYIEDALTSTRLQFRTEAELRKSLSPQKIVDFVVLADGIVVMVEAKGVEAHVMAQVKPDAPTRLQRFTKIIKAVTQFFEMAQALQRENSDLPRFPKAQIFGIVLTYKEHYLGPGLRAWEDFLKEGVEKKIGASESFDPKNLLFCSIHDFELLLQAAGDSPKLFAEIVKRAANDNAVEARQKLIFQQHIGDVLATQRPPRITEAFHRFTDQVRRRNGLEVPERQ